MPFLGMQGDATLIQLEESASKRTLGVNTGSADMSAPTAEATPGTAEASFDATQRICALGTDEHARTTNMNAGNKHKNAAPHGPPDGHPADALVRGREELKTDADDFAPMKMGKAEAQRAEAQAAVRKELQTIPQKACMSLRTSTTGANPGMSTATHLLAQP